MRRYKLSERRVAKYKYIATLQSIRSVAQTHTVRLLMSDMPRFSSIAMPCIVYRIDERFNLDLTASSNMT